MTAGRHKKYGSSKTLQKMDSDKATRNLMNKIQSNLDSVIDLCQKYLGIIFNSIVSFHVAEVNILVCKKNRI